MAQLGGEVWFKVDSATRDGIRRINDSEQTPAKTLKNLGLAAGLCPTWVQTCVFALDGQPPSLDERSAYLALLERALELKVPLKGVLLYGLARPSMQPEAARLSPLPQEWLDGFAAEIRRLGLNVRVSL
jgi:hypothetical protein